MPPPPDDAVGSKSVPTAKVASTSLDTRVKEYVPVVGATNKPLLTAWLLSPDAGTALASSVPPLSGVSTGFDLKALSSVHVNSDATL
jgi:hypothetical protein